MNSFTQDVIYKNMATLYNKSKKNKIDNVIRSQK